MRLIALISVVAALSYPLAAQAQPRERSSDPVVAKKDASPDKEGSGAAAAGGLACMLVWIVGGAMLYFAPTLIALLRGHPNMAPIVVVNFFLGWSLIGWVVALAWAFTAQEKHRADYGRRRRRDDYDD
jgi:hypothetical protein